MLNSPVETAQIVGIPEVEVVPVLEQQLTEPMDLEPPVVQHHQVVVQVRTVAAQTMLLVWLVLRLAVAVAV
jgi:hypothetical protein